VLTTKEFPVKSRYRKQGEKEMENGNEWEVGFMADEDCGWDPIMGDDEDWIETNDEWLDDFMSEEDWA
jgi:hypothetical protein